MARKSGKDRSETKKDGKANKRGKPEKKNKKKKKADEAAGDPEGRLRAVLDQIGPEFIEESARRISFKELEEVASRSEEVLEQFQVNGALERFRKEGETMLELLLDFRSGRYREVSLWAIGVTTFTLCYVLKPIDIIPDSLPVIGRIDDALVVSHGLAMVQSQLRSYRVWKLAAEVQDG